MVWGSGCREQGFCFRRFWVYILGKLSGLWLLVDEGFGAFHLWLLIFAMKARRAVANLIPKPCHPAAAQATTGMAAGRSPMSGRSNLGS